MNTTIAMRRLLRAVYRSSPIKLPFVRGLYFKFRERRDRRRVVVKSIDGIKYQLHLNEFIDSDIFYYGCFEEDTTRAIKRVLQPGMTVLDIGANMGAHTLPMARLVGPEGRVIAFEPMTWAQNKLRTNLALNSFKNIVVETMALSNKNLAAPASFRASWDKYEPTSSGIRPAEQVEFQRLDDYVAAHALPAVDFIKLDVDGYEYKVLEGAIETLKRFRPTILMELGNYTLEQQGDRLESLYQLFDSLDYKFFREADLRPLADFEAIIAEFPDPKTWTINVIVAHSANVETLRGRFES